MLNFTSNPFYILHATPRDNKQKLLELCDEKSILGNSVECENSFSVLCNSRRRLEAEFFWFPCVSDDKIYEIINNLENIDYEKVKAFNPATQAIILLNRKITDMDYRSEHNSKLLVNLYSYDILCLLKEINLDREIAGFPRVGDEYELLNFFNAIRHEVIKRIFEPLKYIEIENASCEMTEFMRAKCLANHGLMDDVANYYRIFSSHYLAKLRLDIGHYCDSMIGHSGVFIYNRAMSMSKLIDMITKYAEIDSPLLLYTELTGNPYDDTKQLIKLIIDFALAMNNIFRETRKALSLAELVLSKFYIFCDVAVNTESYIEKLKEILANEQKTSYAEEARKAREKEMREAEEFAKKQADEAREREEKRIKEKIQYAEEARKAREKEIREAEEFAKKQADEARLREEERIKEKKAAASAAASRKKLILDAVAIDITHSHYSVAIFEDGKPVFIPNKSGKASVPSIIAIDNNKNILFGEDAKKQSYNDNFEVYQLSIGQLSQNLYHGMYSPKLLYRLLFQQIKRDAEKYLSGQIINIVVVVPVNFSKENIKKLTDAARQAGLEIVRFITAANAQAMAYAFEKPEDEKFAFCDIGTDSISIASFEKGNELLETISQIEVGFGSNKFIDDISTYVSDKFFKEKNIDIKADKTAWIRLKEAVNQALHDLISLNTVVLDLPYIVGSERLYMHLSEDEVIKVVRPCLHSILQKVKSVSNFAGISKILIGGNIINLSFIKDYLSNEMHRRTSLYINHGENCAFGAAVQGGILSGKYSKLLLLERDYAYTQDERKETAQDANKKQQASSKQKESSRQASNQQVSSKPETSNKTEKKLDIRYSVSLPSKSENVPFPGRNTAENYSVNIPKFCTCCMNATNEIETIKYTERGIYRHLNFPICKNCRQHRQDIKSVKWIMNSFAGIAGVISAFLISAFDYVSKAWCIPFIATIVIYILLGLIIKTATLSGDHSAKESSVDLSVSRDLSAAVTLTFSNLLYARHFAKANGNLTITGIKKRNRTKTDLLLLSLSHPIANALWALAITLTGLIIMSMMI